MSAVLVVGTTSGAGKSTVAAALCRALVNRGHRVAPFKAQNMSNHAAVTPDGGEIGRAQAMQAAAARIDPDRRMNPILLKPTAGHRSHVVVMGDEQDTTDARAYGLTAQDLKPVVLDALSSLRSEVDWVVGEGAGGAAEINLLDRDLVNLPLAHAAGVPAILVVDIDKGGAFAAAHGTIDLVPEHLAATVQGIVINQFRGDSSLLADGIADLERRHGIPVLGVLPHLGDEPMLGVEDSLDVHLGVVGRTRSDDPVRVAAVRLPHLANPSDLDPFVVEDDVELRWATAPRDLADADLIVLPGSRATVADLVWLRSAGLADALASTDADIVGVCAGFQMLGQTIDDEVESGQGHVAGLGLLDTATTFAEPKIVRQASGSSTAGPVHGYEIRFGRPTLGATPWLTVEGEPEGAVVERVRGTSLHGVFDEDATRTALLADVAARRRTRPPPRTTGGLGRRASRSRSGRGDRWRRGRAGGGAGMVNPPMLRPPGDHHEGALVWRLPDGIESLASAPVGGGRTRPGWVLNIRVPMAYSRIELDEHASEVADDERLTGDGVALFTAASVERHARGDHAGATVDATVGTSKPTWAADASGGHGTWSPGTINTVAFVPATLSEAAAVNIVMTMTEAKTQALLDADIPGTGTASDAVVVLWPAGGDPEPFGGPRSPWGSRIALATYDAVTGAIAT